MENKRKTSGLIPYRIKEGKVFVFLQKRSEEAVRLPGYFCFFGGGAKGGETPEDTLMREIKEELDFIPTNYEFLGKYDFVSGLRYYYVLKVDDSFESNIHVHEGELGKFFSVDDAINEPKLSDDDKIVLRDLQCRLNP